MLKVKVKLVLPPLVNTLVYCLSEKEEKRGRFTLKPALARPTLWQGELADVSTTSRKPTVDSKAHGKQP